MQLLREGCMLRELVLMGDNTTHCCLHRLCCLGGLVQAHIRNNLRRTPPLQTKVTVVGIYNRGNLIRPFLVRTLLGS